MAENNDKINIRLELHDTELFVTIPRDEEELTRAAGKLINETVNWYYDRFHLERGEKEILYMSLLNIALRLERSMQLHDEEPYVDMMQKLTSEIETALKKKK